METIEISAKMYGYGLGFGNGSPVGYTRDGQCKNDFEERVLDENLSISYLAYDDCSSVFTMLYLNGTAITYSLDAEGNQ